MAKNEFDLYSDLNLHGQQIKSGRAQNVGTKADLDTIADKGVGTFAYVTGDHSLYTYNGTTWDKVTAIDSEHMGDYLKESQLGVANGIAQLDGSVKVPLAQLPTGSTSNTIPLVGTAGLANDKFVYVSEGKLITTDLPAIFTFKSTVTMYTDIPAGAAIGDVYNVTGQFPLNNGHLTAPNTSIVRVESGGDVPAFGTYAAGQWDALGGAYDFSSFFEKSSIDTAEEGLGNTDGTVPSSALVKGLLDEKQGAIETGLVANLLGKTLTGGKVIVSTGTDDIGESAITTTELAYLQGVTSGIQAQIDNKVAKAQFTGTPGAYTKVTVSADGIVTAGATASVSELTGYDTLQLVANKADAIGEGSSTEYPSTAAVKTYVEGKVADKVDKTQISQSVTDTSEAGKTKVPSEKAVADQLDAIQTTIDNISDSLEGDYVAVDSTITAETGKTYYGVTVNGQGLVKTGVESVPVSAIAKGTASAGAVATVTATGVEFLEPALQLYEVSIASVTAGEDLVIDQAFAARPVVTVYDASGNVIYVAMQYDASTGKLSVRFNSAPAGAITVSVVGKPRAQAA